MWKMRPCLKCLNKSQVRALENLSFKEYHQTRRQTNVGDPSLLEYETLFEIVKQQPTTRTYILVSSENTINKPRS